MPGVRNVGGRYRPLLFGEWRLRLLAEAEAEAGGGTVPAGGVVSTAARSPSRRRSESVNRFAFARFRSATTAPHDLPDLTRFIASLRWAAVSFPQRLRTESR